MPAINYQNSFIRAYKTFTRRNTIRKSAVAKTIELFAQNPDHPSLHLEKLSGSDIWTIRADQGNRIFFLWSSQGDTAIFFHIGSHDSYKSMN